MASRCLALLLSLAALAAPARGTWSIVLVDTATGEVAIGAATCLANFDLLKHLPVVVVGKGGAVAQSAIDSGATNRKKIFEQLALGTPPEEILQIALAGDAFAESRQYGIVDFSGAGAVFTGAGAGAAKKHVTGSAGTLTYAIQGNVLAGKAIVDLAEEAVLAAPGSLADRLMAGMVAARLAGGDGRCSCSPIQPASCGVPPPGFVKSAHVGFVLVARAGDTDGGCTAGMGCASGAYWMKLNVAHQTGAAADPVDQLVELYAAFVASRLGQPDGVASQALLDHDEVLGDGASTRRLHVALHDIGGRPVLAGGAVLELGHAPGSAGLSSLESVEDHGDGTYTLTLRAGAGLGTDLLAVKATGGDAPATLFPYPRLEHRAALRASSASHSFSAGQGTRFDLLGPDAAAGTPFLVALSASGTEPGTPLGERVLLPLNADRLLALSPVLGSAGVLLNSPGTLDRLARGRAGLGQAQGALGHLAGLSVHAAFFLPEGPPFASNAVAIRLEP